MGLTYIKGDLFTTNAPVIVHGCNAQGVMGAGVAGFIKRKYPTAFEAYKRAFSNSGNKLALGTIIPAECQNRIIINAITQNFYGKEGPRYVSYDAIDNCMSAINEYCLLHNIINVAMPKIGSGLGGGNWGIIKKIIEQNLTYPQVFVYYL